MNHIQFVKLKKGLSPSVSKYILTVAKTQKISLTVRELATISQTLISKHVNKIKIRHTFNNYTKTSEII